MSDTSSPPSPTVLMPVDGTPLETQEHREKRIRRLFNKIDLNGDGVIQPSEIEERLSLLQRNRPARERPLATIQMYAKELVEIADTKHDGHISWDDFLTYVINKENQLYTVFKAMDLNGDGVLQMEEIQAALEASGINTNPGDLLRFLTTLDTDRNRTVDFDEFRSFFLWLPGKVTFASLYAQHMLLDSNYQNIIPLPPKDKDLDTDQRLKYLLCGALAGGVSRTMTAPLDRLRVYFQNRTVNSAGVEGAKNIFGKELTTAIKAIYRNGGLASFWRGNLIELAKMVPGSAIMFSSFEQMKSVISKLEGKKDRNAISPQGRFLAGGLAGMISMTAGFPLSTIKTRVMSTIAMDALPSSQELLQAQAKLKMAGPIPSITNVAHPLNEAQAAALNPKIVVETNSRHPIYRTAVNIYKEHGIRGYFLGLGPALLGVIPYSGINLALFDVMKREYVRRYQRDPSSLLTLLGGSISGAIGSSLVYPIQLVRTRLQAQGTISHPYTYASAWDCVKRTVAREGMGGLYKGLLPSLAKVLPAASITRLVYEKSKDMMHLQ